MKRLFTALTAGIAICAFASPSSAQGSGALYDVLAKKATPASCPHGEHVVKGYVRKDGTVVKGYCKDNPTHEPIGKDNPTQEHISNPKPGPTSHKDNPQ